MLTIRVELKIASYIAHPFWPETNSRIEIEKKSGVNRQRSDDKRIDALKAECSKQGITYDRYLELVELSKRQFYTRDDGAIYIPRHQLAGGFVQVIGGSPKALRGRFTKDSFRALVQVGDFDTGRTERSGVFARFVKLEGSNQRSWQENDYIGQYLDEGEPFVASGVLGLTDAKDEDTVKVLMESLVANVGIGAARKMGFGRGVIESWEHC
jgi:hypothetical protein